MTDKVSNRRVIYSSVTQHFYIYISSFQKIYDNSLAILQSLEIEEVICNYSVLRFF